jgi:hypothetical protein
MDFFPSDCALGRYSHDGFADWPLESDVEHYTVEVAGRLFEHDAWIVAAQPRAPWIPVARNGWTISQRGGTRGQLVHLTR